MIKLNSKSIRANKSLADIFDEPDDHKLLDVKSLGKPSSPVDQTNQQFVEINQFFEKHNRPPQADSNDINEKILARRLKAMRKAPDIHQQVAAIDVHGLICTAESTTPITAAVPSAELVTSLSDIFDDDDGLLDFEDDSIFALNNVSNDKKALPEDIATRRPCPDFTRYTGIFNQAQQLLKAGKISTVRYSHGLKIAQGDIFVLYGVMCYVNALGEALPNYKKYNARLHLIFENGTESDMLYQSLGAGLIRDKEGRKVANELITFKPQDMPTPAGMIYIVSTQSNNPALAPYQGNLYKIGYTDTSVEQRTANAANDRTFLEAPVRIVSTATCYNFNPQRLETLIHGFLANQRLNIKLTGKDGKSYSPREWFNVPFATAQAVISHIIDGTISLYRMDNTTGQIVKKK